MGRGSQQKKFESWKLKIRPKIQHMRLNNFGADGNIFMKLLQTTCREAGVIICVQVLEGMPPKIWEGQKNLQISAQFLTTFEFDSEYPRNGLHVKNLTRSWPTTNPPTLDKDTWWTLVHIPKSYRGAYWPTQVDIFRDTIFRPLKGAAPSNFYTR